MNHIFNKQLRKFVQVFFDDLLIYSSRWEEHLRHVEEVIRIMEVLSHPLYLGYHGVDHLVRDMSHSMLHEMSIYFSISSGTIFLSYSEHLEHYSSIPLLSLSLAWPMRCTSWVKVHFFKVAERGSWCSPFPLCTQSWSSWLLSETSIWLSSYTLLHLGASVCLFSLSY